MKIVIATMLATVGLLVASDTNSQSESTSVIVRQAPLNETYRAVLNQVKTDGIDIETASQDAGIETSLSVTGGYRQTGTRYKIVFIPGSNGIEVQVKALEQKRFKALKAEPWSDPKPNPAKASELAAKLKTELGW